MPGFVRALTAADVPKNVYTILCLIGVEPDEEQVLADERVRYRGEPIVAVVAETEAAAVEAVKRVRFDLEELPAVFDVEEALKPDAPRVTHWDTNHFWYEGHHCRRVRYGDAAAARAAADHVIEGTYQTSADRARADRDHRLHRQAGGRRAHHRPHQHAGAVLLARQHGDHPADRAVAAALHRRHGGRRVRRQGRRHHRADRVPGGAQDGPAGPLRLHARGGDAGVARRGPGTGSSIVDGVMDDGRIVSREVTSYHDAGAYSRHSPYGATKHAANASGPYTIPNVSIDVHCVYTNRQPSSAFRGFGVTEASFATEMQMDRISRAIGVDPWSCDC